MSVSSRGTKGGKDCCNSTTWRPPSPLRACRSLGACIPIDYWRTTNDADRRSKMFLVFAARVTKNTHKGNLPRRYNLGPTVSIGCSGEVKSVGLAPLSGYQGGQPKTSPIQHQCVMVGNNFVRNILVRPRRICLRDCQEISGSSSGKSL
jgi:hypothetical protein